MSCILTFCYASPQRNIETKRNGTPKQNETEHRNWLQYGLPSLESDLQYFIDVDFKTANNSRKTSYSIVLGRVLHLVAYADKKNR